MTLEVYSKIWYAENEEKLVDVITNITSWMIKDLKYHEIQGGEEEIVDKMGVMILNQFSPHINLLKEELLSFEDLKGVAEVCRTLMNKVKKIQANAAIKKGKLKFLNCTFLNCGASLTTKYRPFGLCRLHGGKEAGAKAKAAEKEEAGAKE